MIKELRRIKAIKMTSAIKWPPASAFDRASQTMESRRLGSMALRLGHGTGVRVKSGAASPTYTWPAYAGPFMVAAVGRQPAQ